MGVRHHLLKAKGNSMTNKEIIPELKINMKKWSAMKPDQCEEMERIGYMNFLYLGDHGEWIEPVSGGFCPVNRYRLRQNYEPPEPEVVQCEICTDDLELRYKTPNERSVYGIEIALRMKDFIGFQSGEWIYGRLYKHKESGTIREVIPCMSIDEYEVLPIDKVLFRSKP